MNLLFKLITGLVLIHTAAFSQKAIPNGELKTRKNTYVYESHGRLISVHRKHSIPAVYFTKEARRDAYLGGYATDKPISSSVNEVFRPKRLRKFLPEIFNHGR